MRFGRRSRLSDFGVTLAILLTLGIFGYAGLEIFQASRDVIGGFFKTGPARPTLAIPSFDATPAATPVASAATPAAKPAGTPAAGVAAAGTPTPQTTATAGRVVRIGNTNGDGVFIRRTPNLNDRLTPWPDNTTLDVVGEDVTADGLVWKKVKDPRGNIGYVPAQYLVPVN